MNTGIEKEENSVWSFIMLWNLRLRIHQREIKMMFLL